MRVDAHQHYWQPERGDYGFLTPESRTLYRDYLPNDLKSSLAACGYDRTIVVQSAPTVAETLYLLDLAEKDQTIAGVVGWVDFEAEPTEFDHQLNCLLNQSRIVGVRPMLQDLPPDYMLQPRILRNLIVFAKIGLVFEWLVYSRHLPFVYQVMEACPGLKCVINHLAKPDLRDEAGVLEWREWMSRLAKLPAVACKVSGLFTESGPEKPSEEALKPYTTFVFEQFGEDRVMFGSDWPVSLLAGEYEEVVSWTDSLVPKHWNEAQRDKLYGGNAIRWYGLQDKL
ncbi:amidohydrolase family protein [Cohnella terricola]|nr:amidohydrolase family protein [Cohnella terricola]